MFGMNWLKPLIKKRMNPITPEVARKKIHNLSMTYAFLGWNFVAFMLYLTWKKAIPEGADKSKYIYLLRSHYLVKTCRKYSKVFILNTKINILNFETIF